MPVGAVIGVGLLSTAVSAYAQHKAGQAQQAAGDAQQAAANSQADLADYNASVADLQAKDAVEKGQQDADTFRTQIRGAIGAQRAGISANNVDVGFGSAVDVQADAAYTGELDALQIKNNAARTAWGFQVQAQDLRTSADIARKTGVYDAAAGSAAAGTANLAAAGTLIGGAASILGKKYGYGT
ncbi:MAG TPA: hypothetical protein VKR23_15885 [Gaiellaceae bacterium]|nr:hypothetical protein [Gaiellaceae bacterium]